MSEKRNIYKVRGRPSSLDAFKNLPCALPFWHQDYIPPEPGEVAALTELAGWSQNEAAKLVGVKFDPRKGSTTIRKWKTEKGSKEHRDIPYSAWRLMLLYAGVVGLKDGIIIVDDTRRVADNPGG